MSAGRFLRTHRPARWWAPRFGQAIIAKEGSHVDHVNQILVVVPIGHHRIVITSADCRRAALVELIGIASAMVALLFAAWCVPLTASHDDFFVYSVLCALALSLPGVVHRWWMGRWGAYWVSPLGGALLLLVMWWIF